MRFAGDDQSGWNYLPCALPIEQSNRAGIVSRKKAHVDRYGSGTPSARVRLEAIGQIMTDMSWPGMWTRLDERHAGARAARRELR